LSRARDAVDVVNFDTMKLVATLPAETNPHTLNIDPLTHHLYVYEDDGNVVDVWHYTNAGHDRMTFTDGGQQVTASVGAVARVPAACRTCCNPRVPAACQPMGAAAGSAGAGGGAMQPEATTSASGLLATLDHGSAASAIMAIFGHGG